MIILIVIVFVIFIISITAIVLHRTKKKYINLTIFCSARDGISDDYKNTIRSLRILTKKARIRLRICIKPWALFTRI